MRPAPPVRSIVHRHGAWLAVQALLAALAAATFGGWLGLRLAQSPAGSAAVAAALAGLAAWSVGRRQRPQPAAPGLLWDGRQWSLDGVSGRLRLMIDLGAWMLLAFDGDAGLRRQWIVTTRATAAGEWHLLRAAVHARGSAQAVLTGPLPDQVR